MSKTKQVNPSWDRQSDEIHSPEGVEEVKKAVKNGLKRLYTGIAENMWRYEGFEDERFEDCMVMSRYTVPEKFLFRNGECCIFEYGDKLYFLPAVYNKQVNIYGYMSGWSPLPYGYSAIGVKKTDAFDEIYSLKLDESNSVMWRNDMFGQSDEEMIDKMVDLLVDNTLSVSQIQLIASMPFCFYTDSENLLTAKNYFLSLQKHSPAVFINKYSDDPKPIVQNFGVKIDPSLFDIFSHFEAVLLSYLGFPVQESHKRAQQSVSEVQNNDDKVSVRRKEKLRQREMACERTNKIFGTSLKVFSIIDEERERLEQQAMSEQENMRGGEDVSESD